ncbi:MAG TPA: cytochrome c peroxidase [Steroidobacteraceae bacterium]|nr:cytochrome c peroxidase [Steroidobacteraceae bacterium]
MARAACGALLALCVLCVLDRAAAAAGEASTDYTWHLPRGFPRPAVPADNPMSQAKVDLGRRLFYDLRLSVTGRHSCASCHSPASAFTDHRARAVGATGATLPHSAMALVNVAYNVSYGWSDPDVRSLEAQMLTPMLNQHPVELGLAGHEQALVDALSAEGSLRAAFAAAFPRAPAVSFQHIIKAIAAFERTLISGDSPFDRYVFEGESGALSPAAKRGMALFFSARAGCANCHFGFNFSGNWRDTEGDTGAPSFANNGTSDKPMRVPTLRNIALTAPYMHDGRFATLDAVLDHYSHLGQVPDDQHGGTRDPRLKSLALTSSERHELIAFLESLTDPGFIAHQTAQR